MQKHWAIFTGRFQPFHSGHLDFIRLIGEKVSRNVIVGVCFKLREESFYLQSNRINHPFLEMAEKKHAKHKNPFSYWEVYEMISQALRPFRKELNVRILPLLRNQIWWPLPSYWLPPRRTWVFNDIDEKYENLKVNFYRLLLNDPIVTLRPRFIIHNSDIIGREYFPHELKEFFPRVVLEILNDINGFNRLGMKLKND